MLINLTFVKRKINCNAFIMRRKSFHILRKSKQVEVTDFFAQFWVVINIEI